MSDKTTQRRIDSFMNHLSYLGFSKESFHEASPSSPKSAVSLSNDSIYRLQKNNTAAVESGTSCSTAGRTHSWRDCCCCHSCLVLLALLLPLLFSLPAKLKVLLHEAIFLATCNAMLTTANHCKLLWGVRRSQLSLQLAMRSNFSPRKSYNFLAQHGRLLN